MPWIVLLVLIVAEVAGIVWWLRKEYYPVMFNGNAPIIYSAILAVDLVIAWLVSMTETPGGTFGMSLLALLGVILVVVVFLFTLFIRWIIKGDLTDIK